MCKAWSALESIPGFIAVPAVWRALLAEDFAPFRTLCLQICPDPAQSFPCPRDWGCAQRIILHPQKSPSLAAPKSDEGGSPRPIGRGEGQGEGFPTQQSTNPPFTNPIFTGVCESDPPNCPDTLLTLADITPLELSWSRLGRALCKAFGCDTKLTELPIPNTIQIGSWSADAVPVILTIHAHRQVFRRAIAELVARLRQPFILFAPTTRFLDATTQELLANVKASFFPLDTTVLLTENATLQPVKTPGELFAKFTPEEKLPEDSALRAFAILKSMDTDEAIRKAPVFRVFRLYCMENLSVEQVAKRLRCSKATIINRLRVIRQKTGTDPENLRAYSAQFTRIDLSLSDPRARRIRRSATEDSEAQQEE